LGEYLVRYLAELLRQDQESGGLTGELGDGRAELVSECQLTGGSAWQPVHFEAKSFATSHGRPAFVGGEPPLLMLPGTSANEGGWVSVVGPGDELAAA